LRGGNEERMRNIIRIRGMIDMGRKEDRTEYNTI
jgi:hypothetical protein